MSIIGGQACSLGKSDSYDTIAAADLTALVDAQSDQEKRALAQNETQRKAMITQFKQMFSLAQAAQAEGLDKSEAFKQKLSLSTDMMLIQEAQKRSLEIKYSEEEGKAFATAHDKEFNADLKMITEGQKQELAPDQVEMMRGQWGEMRVRASKAREAGLEKDPVVRLMAKFRRANLLAEAYSDQLQKKLKPTPEELKKYLDEHPEADTEKIRQKAEQLLTRVKKGEDFNAIASQYTEDGTREQGGDLGWFQKGKMDPDFEKVAFALQKGQTSELVKTKFGFHIIKLEDKRIAKPEPEPKPSPGTPTAPPAPSAAPTGPQEEVKARHIYLSTQEAEGVEQMVLQKKVKRAMEDASLQYAVKAPEDFAVTVAGLKRDGGRPDTGSGKIITPQ